jgi:type I restriction enzyme S subunit
MSFPRYKKYKPSGVEWLGDVPEHWEVLALRRCLVEHRQGYYSQSDYVDSGVKLLRITDLREFGGVNFSECPQVEDREELKPFLLQEADFVFARTGGAGTFGLVETINEQVAYASYLIRFRFTGKTNSRFLKNFFLSSGFQEAVRQNIHGGVNQNIHAEDIKNQYLSLPPFDEQAAIAAFLDRETAKIDELVAEQRRLMELLKEKRQAVISHAVTQGLSGIASATTGLNPKAPMKPSGIEWLGDVPEHWEAVQVKHLARDGKKTFTDGDWIEAPFVTDSGVRLIQTGNVGIGFYKEQGYRYVSEETFEKLNCTEFMPGDVLICRLDGPVGRACLAPDLGIRMITSVDNAILKCADHVLPEYVVAILSSVPWISWIDALCRVGGGFRLRVSRSQLGEIRVPLPPFEEQVAIMEYLTSQTNGFDTLTAEAQRAIDLLQERRTALISAAVTGQIDVRG